MTTPIALVVDDDHQLLSLASRLLAMGGFTVLPATSAEEALSIAAAAGQIDILFTDVVLPGRSGVALATDLRVLRPELPVLLTTGEWHGDVRIEIDESGFPYLLKPYGLDDVHDAVRRLLGPATEVLDR